MEKSNSQIVIKYGLILGVLTILFTLLSYLNIIDSLDPKLRWVTTIFSLVSIAIIVYFALSEIKNENQGYLKFGTGLSSSVLISIISGILSGFFSMIYLKFIDGSFIDKTKEATIAEYEKQGMNAAQIDTALGFMEFMFHPGFLFLMGLFGSAIMGLIIGLVLSANMKKEKSIFESR